MKKENESILFYEHEFYVCSNFSSFEVVWQGKNWKTSEHAYQAAKFEDTMIRQEIQRARSSHDAMKLAKIVYNIHIRKDWRDMKLQVMEDIVREKLSQHFYIQKKLLQSGDRNLVEDSPRDSYWGWGPNKDGENNLGQIWMKLRDELKSGKIYLLKEDYK